MASHEKSSAWPTKSKKTTKINIYKMNQGGVLQTIYCKFKVIVEE